MGSFRDSGFRSKVAVGWVARGEQGMVMVDVFAVEWSRRDFVG